MMASHMADLLACSIVSPALLRIFLSTRNIINAEIAMETAQINSAAGLVNGLKFIAYEASSIHPIPVFAVHISATNRIPLPTRSAANPAMQIFQVFFMQKPHRLSSFGSVKYVTAVSIM